MQLDAGRAFWREFSVTGRSDACGENGVLDKTLQIGSFKVNWRRIEMNLIFYFSFDLFLDFR